MWLKLGVPPNHPKSVNLKINSSIETHGFGYPALAEIPSRIRLGCLRQLRETNHDCETHVPS